MTREMHELGRRLWLRVLLALRWQRSRPSPLDFGAVAQQKSRFDSDAVGPFGIRTPDGADADGHAPNVRAVRAGSYEPGPGVQQRGVAGNDQSRDAVAPAPGGVRLPQDQADQVRRGYCPHCGNAVSMPGPRLRAVRYVLCAVCLREYAVGLGIVEIAADVCSAERLRRVYGIHFVEDEGEEFP